MKTFKVGVWVDRTSHYELEVKVKDDEGEMEAREEARTIVNDGEGPEPTNTAVTDEGTSSCVEVK